MVYAHLIIINLDKGVLRFTDYHRDLIYESNTFISGKVKLNTGIVQKSQPSATDFNIAFSAVDQSVQSAFIDQDYRGRRIIVNRAVISQDSVVSSTTWLDGDINKYRYASTLNDSTINITVSTVFGSAGVRKIDASIVFADTISDDKTLYWGRTSDL